MIPLRLSRTCLLLLISGVCCMFGNTASAQNPYLPLWEYVPDGEPYVFEDPDKPGEYRVYVYGSHDSLKKYYCGREQVVWSAPVNDLSNWRYDGIIYRLTTDRDGNLLNPNGEGDVLYAPDIAEVVEKDGTKTYYFYPNVQGKREGVIAKSKRPDGPFESCSWSKDNAKLGYSILRFDPAVFVDDDGRVYGYWGFNRSYGAELDPATMCTVKSGTKIIEDMVSGHKQEGVFNFFEASSLRKIKDKYVFIYSRWTKDGEFGLPKSNYTLAYAYSDTPLGPWTYGGTIIDGRARDIDENGKTIATAHPQGNTHGSICEINGKWWVFYHRQTGLSQYSRQAMVAPIEVSVEEGKGGKVTISEGEYTSEGFSTDGLNPLHKTAAGWACYYTGPKPAWDKFPQYFFSGSYIANTYLDLGSYQGPFNLKKPFCPVVNNTAGSTVGYKYFNFSKIAGKSKTSISFSMIPKGIDGTLTIMLGSPYKSRGGKVIGKLRISKDAPQELAVFSTPVNGIKGRKGKQALFFLFDSATKDSSLCDLYDFRFVVE